MGHQRLIQSFPPHSLEWDFEERTIDRITAVGFASREEEAGEAMLRVDALDHVALKKVILLIIRKLNHKFKITRGFAQKIAYAAMHEYLRSNCIYCGGKGESFQKGRVVTECKECGGTGQHRYSNKDRAALIGTGSRYNEKAYEEALTFVRDAVANIRRKAALRLVDD